MSNSLQGKFIAVRGSTQGLGEDMAQLWAERGVGGIVNTGWSRGRGEAVATRLATKQRRTLFVQGELQDPATCHRIIARADEEFSKLDGLVNAAACTERGSLEETSVDHWDKFMAVNLRAPYLLMQDAVRMMQRENQGGSIVNILSMSAHGETPSLTPYSVS